MKAIYQFTAQDKAKAEEAIENAINKVDDNQVIESLQEVLNLLHGIPDDKTLAQVIQTAIETAIGEDGVIATWADGRYTKQTEQVETPGE